MFRVNRKSHRKYQKVLRELQPHDSKHYGASTRSLVKKDIWVEKPDGIFHYLIISGNSILHLNQMRSSQTHAIEEMHDITCLLQQKKYYVGENNEECDASFGRPVQQVCMLKLSEGTYNYFNNNFLGDNAYITVYQAEGHKLSSESIVDLKQKICEGKADSIKFSIEDNEPKLITRNFDAHIFTEANL